MNSSEKISGWCNVSNNLDNEYNWTRQYIEFNRRKYTLTFHANQCIRSTTNEILQVPIIDCNSNLLSISSSLNEINDRRSSVNIIQSTNILPILSEPHRHCISPLLSQSIITDDNIVTIHPTSFTDRRSSSISTSRLKLSQLFVRSSNPLLPSLKRTKLERDKHPSLKQNPSSILNIPSTRHRRSRSHESLLICNGPLGSILPFRSFEIELNNYHIRCIHPSLLSSSFDFNKKCIQIRNCKENHSYYLYSNERNLFLYEYLQYSQLEKINDQSRIDYSLEINIFEGKGFSIKKNSRYYLIIYLDDDIYGKTTSRETLFWGEYFHFKHLPKDYSNLRCQIYSERRRRRRTSHIGSIEIPLSTMINNQFNEQWYSIQMKNSKENSLQIRIKIKYQTIEILPIQFYEYLQQYIHRNYLQLIQIVQPYIHLTDKDDIAISMTRIAHCLSYSTSYLVDIIQLELLSIEENSLIFRGNTIASKSLESYMKLIGQTYLHETLAKILTDIISSNHNNESDLEVDPDRLRNFDQLENNQIKLKFLSEQIWFEIQKSSHSFPHELKIIFGKLRQLSSSNETIFNFLSGSVFLRFLCPAILSPNLFGLTQEYINEKASRKLILIAKTLQTLANFSKFGSKESYMTFMNDFILEESNNMKRFLINISTFDCNQSSTMTEVIDLGKEYAILHRTLVNLFKQLDTTICPSLNELNDILEDLSFRKSQSFQSNHSSSSSHTDEQISQIQIQSTQYASPQIDVKTFNHSFSNKEMIDCQRSSMLNLSEEEKDRRIEYENERLGKCQLNSPSIDMIVSWE